MSKEYLFAGSHNKFGAWNGRNGNENELAGGGGLEQRGLVRDGEGEEEKQVTAWAARRGTHSMASAVIAAMAAACAWS